MMTAMRQAVIMSKTRNGAQIEKNISGASAIPSGSLAVGWIDALHLATRGGAQALGLPTGIFAPGIPFDAQQSESQIANG